MNLVSSPPSSSRHDGRSFARSPGVACFVPRRAKPTSLDRGCCNGACAGIDTLATRNLDTGVRRPKDVGCRERRVSGVCLATSLANTHTRNDDATVHPSGRDEMVHHRTRTRPQFPACDAVELGRTGAAAESRMSSVTFRTLKRFLGA